MIPEYIEKNFTSESDEDKYLLERGRLALEGASEKDIAIILHDIKYLLTQIRNKMYEGN